MQPLQHLSHRHGTCRCLAYFATCAEDRVWSWGARGEVPERPAHFQRPALADDHLRPHQPARSVDLSQRGQLVPAQDGNDFPEDLGHLAVRLAVWRHLFPLFRRQPFLVLPTLRVGAEEFLLSLVEGRRSGLYMGVRLNLGTVEPDFRVDVFEAREAVEEPSVATDAFSICCLFGFVDIELGQTGPV
jgi:hypothetical protein